MTTIIETLRVRFRDEEQHAMHQILLAAGFSFTVNPDLTIGGWYENKQKLLGVEMKGNDNLLSEYVTHNLKYKPQTPDRIIDSKQYTTQEWDWMTIGTSSSEMLKRELHILLNVRPHCIDFSKGLPNET